VHVSQCGAELPLLIVREPGDHRVVAADERVKGDAATGVALERAPEPRRSRPQGGIPTVLSALVGLVSFVAVALATQRSYAPVPVDHRDYRTLEAARTDG
jgi:hypothetical protein